MLYSVPEDLQVVLPRQSALLSQTDTHALVLVVI
jgi:hypothetical protein